MGRVGKSPKTIGCSILSSIGLSLYLSLWRTVLTYWARGNSASRVNLSPVLSMLHVCNWKCDKFLGCSFLDGESASFCGSLPSHHMRAAGYCTYEGNTRSTVISIRLCELGNFLEQECMFGIDISVLVFLIHNQESQETTWRESKKDDTR